MLVRKMCMCAFFSSTSLKAEFTSQSTCARLSLAYMGKNKTRKGQRRHETYCCLLISKHVLLFETFDMKVENCKIETKIPFCTFKQRWVMKSTNVTSCVQLCCSSSKYKSSHKWCTLVECLSLMRKRRFAYPLCTITLSKWRTASTKTPLYQGRGVQ